MLRKCTLADRQRKKTEGDLGGFSHVRVGKIYTLSTFTDRAKHAFLSQQWTGYKTGQKNLKKTGKTT